MGCEKVVGGYLPMGMRLVGLNSERELLLEDKKSRLLVGLSVWRRVTIWPDPLSRERVGQISRIDGKQIAISCGTWHFKCFPMQNQCEFNFFGLLVSPAKRL
jgi:hypothetical protein